MGSAKTKTVGKKSSNKALDELKTIASISASECWTTEQLQMVVDARKRLSGTYNSNDGRN